MKLLDKLLGRRKSIVKAERLKKSPFKSVTQAEHDAFIAAYPRPLKRGLLTICTPEILQHNDFTLGKWPESVVASYSTYGGDPTDIWAPVPGNWEILKEAP